jgi:hypothetical protein
VLCIYLVTAATAVAAIVLPHVQSTFAAVLIFVQTVLILGVVAILEQHPMPVMGAADEAPRREVGGEREGVGAPGSSAGSIVR